MLMALAHSRPHEVAVYSVNTNYHAGLSRRLRIGGTPTVVVFRGGEEVGRVVGVVSWEELVGLVDTA
jgi:thioredoxin-like negative regulator of GroEL